MAVTSAVTDKGDELILHSGNISGVAKLTKRATQSTANEVENYSNYPYVFRFKY